MPILGRLMQSLPLVIALIVIAVLLYLVISYIKSPETAEKVLINVFTAITGALSAFFGIACLYALFEHNQGMLELFGIFLLMALMGLAIIRILAWSWSRK